MSSSSSKKGKAKKIQSFTHRRVDRENLHRKGNEIDTKDNLFALPYLTTPILVDILSRLEIKPLFKCCLVCKRWASIISTSDFSQVHLLRSPTKCLIQQHSIYDDEQPKVVHMLDPEYPCSLENKLLFKPMINLPNIELFLSNSCNGLVCLVELGFNVYNLYVCNPILAEYITLPSPPVNKDTDSITCLFGFSQKTNQYKVVVNDDNSPNMIYTFGQGSWKNIGSSPGCILNCDYNALVNGCLHWMSLNSSEDHYTISCFNFDTEQFLDVPEPSEFAQHKKGHRVLMRVGVLNGNLSIFSSKFPVSDGVVIWVMKNYGVKESWCKDFVINCTFDYARDGFVELEPIMIKGNGEILIICDNQFLILYDTISKTFRSKQQILGENISCRALAYTPSLISLKDVAKGENIKVVGRN